MKIILCGTPDFVIPVFEEVKNEFEVVAVISQPDPKANRGYKTIQTPVAMWAKKNKLVLHQPSKIIDILKELKELQYDMLLTYAYGQIIPKDILNIAKIANVNIHGSLLPKYRGAAPIQHALLNGDSITGVSLIYMIDKMDAGDIIFQKSIEIQQNSTTFQLLNQLSDVAKEHIKSWLLAIKNKKINPYIQDLSLVTFAPKLLKENGRLDHSKSFELNNNIIRAYNDNPGAFTYINGKRIKVFYATRELVKNAPWINVSDSKMYFTDYQFESKKRIQLK